MNFSEPNRIWKTTPFKIGRKVEMRNLTKKSRKTSQEFVAYNAEKNFLDKMSEMSENMLDHGTVATDTVGVGPFRLHWAYKSPFKVQSNGESTTIGISGGPNLEIGITFDHGDIPAGRTMDTVSKESNPFYDPSEGSCGEGNGEENRPRP